MKFTKQKYSLLFILSLLFSTIALAQPPRKNEIGLGLRTTYSNSLSNSGAREILFKHWFKPWQAYRVSIGIENMHENIRTLYEAHNDTLLRKSVYSTINMAYVGGGVEAHRHFYKRVYLLAGIDTRFMYGKGKEEQQTHQYQQNIATPSSGVNEILLSTTHHAISRFRWDLKPSIGAKLVFPRITVGIESFPMSMSYTTAHNNSIGASYNLFDLDIGGNLSNRLFVCYRF